MAKTISIGKAREGWMYHARVKTGYTVKHTRGSNSTIDGTNSYAL